MKLEKKEMIGYCLIGIGVVFLILTFYFAYTLFIAKLGIVPSSNLSEALGSILGPLIEAVIRIMYLGIMGWIGSISTIRGIQLLKEDKQDQKSKMVENNAVIENKNK